MNRRVTQAVRGLPTPATRNAMSLRTYRQKRAFDGTPEPRGDGKVPGRAGHAFVIQKHAATRLHHDFRLEWDDVLWSWAVPKGPPTEPGTKVLAVRTEDHPLEYESFEGVIPKGHYGAGTVMLWDRGTWLPDGDPRRDLAAGKLDFTLHGERLRGRWSLVRMSGGARGDAGKENWLLIKRNDSTAQARTVAPGLDRSVATGRSMAQIATGRPAAAKATPDAPPKSRARKSATVPKPRPRKEPKQRTASRRTSFASAASAIDGAQRAPQPGKLMPQLATLVAKPPDGDEWLHEVKFDGYRLVAFLDAGKVRLRTRTGQDWTARFPTIAAAIAALPVSRAIVDGEVVVLSSAGVSQFQALQNWLDRPGPQQLVYFAFDLPHCEGFDLTHSPLRERKALLERLLPAGGPRGVLRYSEHVVGHGPVFFAEACSLGLEGAIAKRADAPYQDRRTRTWLKVKCLQRQEFVVGGWTRPEGSRAHFGALLVGVYDEGKLRYAGKVGTGFTTTSLAQLMQVMQRLGTDEPPFVDPPRGAEGRRATWVRPETVVEIAFTEWTADGHLRHPSFQGVREDKDPRTIGRERPATAPAGKDAAQPPIQKAPAKAARTAAPTAIAGIRLSNPDRVLYPELGLSKLDLARYYESVAPFVLPHVTGRPLTLLRCPEGRTGECFFQKHLAPMLPEPVRGIRVKPREAEYLGIDDLPGLVTLVQFGALELHPWGSKEDLLDRPDRIVLDLDPAPDVPWARVITAALHLRDLLAALGLTAFARTTGGKGLHVVLPVERRSSWDEVKTFARDLVAALARTDAKGYVLTASKARREGRIFLDYLRNSRGATAIASYSSRAREGAPVAMPVRWEQLNERLDPLAFTVLTAPKRLAADGDAWAGFFAVKQSLTAAMREAVQKL